MSSSTQNTCVPITNSHLSWPPSLASGINVNNGFSLVNKKTMMAHWRGVCESIPMILWEGKESQNWLASRAAVSDIINTPTAIIDEQRNAPIQPCERCHWFEPISPTKYFIDVGDSNTGRCVCLACEKTMVATYDDIVPLWDKAKSKCFIMSLLIQKLTLVRDGSLDSNFFNISKHTLGYQLHQWTVGGDYLRG